MMLILDHDSAFDHCHKIVCIFYYCLYNTKNYLQCVPKIRHIEIFNQNRMFLWNFHDCVKCVLIFRPRQFPKIKCII